MASQAKLFLSNPTLKGPYLMMAQYLDEKSFINLSLVSRNNYIAIYKLAIESQTLIYQLNQPSHFLTFDERTYPLLSKDIVVGKNDNLELLKKRIKDIAFASNPLHSRLLTVLNTAFPERISYAEQIETERAPLVESHQKWIRGEVFAGTTGLEGPIFLQNIHQLITSYQARPCPSILQMLRNAQTILPSANLQQCIDLVEENPQAIVGPIFRDFEAEAGGLLKMQSIVQQMLDIKDVISKKLDGFSDWNEIDYPSQMFLLMNSLSNILSQIQFLQNLPSGILVDLTLSASEIDQLKQTYASTLNYYALQQQALMQPGFNHENVFAEIDIPNYMAQLNNSLLIFDKVIQINFIDLNKRNQHTIVLWRAIFLEDKRSLQCIIDSSAFLYFQWGEILEHVLDNKQFDLFFHLISYRQILDSLSPEKFKEIKDSLFEYDNYYLDKYNPSVLLPLFNHPSVVETWGNSYTGRKISRSLLPFFLGEGNISPLQWLHLCELNVRRHSPPKIFGITLNALLRKNQTELVTTFLAHPTLQKAIPSVSSDSDSLLRFFSSYPLLWDRLCCHPEEGEQFLLQMFRDLYAEKWCILLGPETCAEIIQFLLTNPEILKPISELGYTTSILSKINEHYSLETLDSQESIQKALEQLNKNYYQYTSEPEQFLAGSQPTINSLAGILFAHDRYLLKIIFRMAQIDAPSARSLWELFDLLKKGAPLLTILSIPSDNMPREIPYKTLDLLSAMGCCLWEYRDKAPTVGWDTIFKTAAAHPPLLELLASYPTIAVHMPQHLRNNYLAPELQEDFQALSAPQEGSSRSVAERISRIMETHRQLIDKGWRMLQENCSFFRRVAIIFKLPKFLSSARYDDFYKNLPFFYRIIGKIGKLWANFRG